MKKYTTKNIEVEAFQITKDNLEGDHTWPLWALERNQPGQMKDVSFLPDPGGECLIIQRLETPEVLYLYVGGYLVLEFGEVHAYSKARFNRHFKETWVNQRFKNETLTR